MIYIAILYFNLYMNMLEVNMKLYEVYMKLEYKCFITLVKAFIRKQSIYYILALEK